MALDIAPISLVSLLLISISTLPFATLSAASIIVLIGFVILLDITTICKIVTTITNKPININLLTCFCAFCDAKSNLSTISPKFDNDKEATAPFDFKSPNISSATALTSARCCECSGVNLPLASWKAPCSCKFICSKYFS